MISFTFRLIFVVGCCICGDVQLMNYLKRETVMNGLVFPREIDAVIGEEVYLKIIEPVINQTQCLYRMTGEGDEDIRSPHKSNLAAWSTETCGLWIKNITKSDEGFWRLTSTNTSSDYARGVAFIQVRADANKDMAAQKSITFPSVDDVISPMNTTYCYVQRTGSTKTNFPQHEKCDFPKFHSNLEAIGTWNVVSGVKGKTQEISFDVNVHANVEDIKTFVEQKTDSVLNMKCKLMHSSKKTMKFCRFLRLNDDVGFNLEEGGGNEAYRYFGNGFATLECGISIRQPNENDKSMWKCFVGIEVKNKTTTIGALIDGSEKRRIPSADDIEADDVYGLEHTSVNMLCKHKAITDYCWFRNPAGHKISLSDRKKFGANDTYRYYGSGVKLGECGLTIMNATHDDSGTWSCHIGAADLSATDSTKEISVRISESSLVSTYLFQDVEIGSSLSLECRSIPAHVPIDYCRFVAPDGTGFSINEASTEHASHMHNYYFNPNHKMKSGFCSIIVKKVERSHMGQWTCAARLSGSEHESADEFRITVYSSDISMAGISGLAVGFVLICTVVFLVVHLIYRKRQQTARQRRVTQNTIVRYIDSENVSISSMQSNDGQSPRVIH